MRLHLNGGGSQVQVRRQLVSKRGVCADAHLLDDGILKQSMNGDDVAPQELFVAGDALPDRHAGVGHELQVQVWDLGARVALAAGRLPHIAATTPKTEVATLDRVENHAA